MINISNIQKVPETLRVDLESDFYCLIVPMEEHHFDLKPGEKAYDVWLHYVDSTFALHMFSAKAEKESQLVSLVLNHVEETMMKMVELMDEDFAEENEYDDEDYTVHPKLNQDAKNVIASMYHNYTKCLPEYRQLEKAEGIKAIMTVFDIPELK